MGTFFKVILILTVASCECGIIRDVIQWNIAGLPQLHKDVSIPFDSEIAVKRSRFYQEVNGYHGEKAIERIGLGIDGNDLERLAEQQKRDEGYLNGKSYDEYKNRR